MKFLKIDTLYFFANIRQLIPLYVCVHMYRQEFTMDDLYIVETTVVFINCNMVMAFEDILF